MQRSEAKLFGRAMSNGWPVSDEIKKEVVDYAIETIRDPGMSPNRRLAAARLLVLADTVNVRRESIESEEHREELRASTSVVRAALATPAAREALAQLAAEMPNLQAPTTDEPLTDQ